MGGFLKVRSKLGSRDCGARRGCRMWKRGESGIGRCMASMGNSGVSDFLRSQNSLPRATIHIIQDSPTEVCSSTMVPCHCHSSPENCLCKFFRQQIFKRQQIENLSQVPVYVLPAQVKISFKWLYGHDSKARTTSQQTCNHHWQRIKPQMGCTRSSAECASPDH
jgi:hypothetical protein